MNFHEFQTRLSKTDGMTENLTLGMLWEEQRQGILLVKVQQPGKGHYSTTSKCFLNDTLAL
jgi:hypothetical protein